MNSGLGLALAIISGALAGSFALPMKKTVKWAWENVWLVFVTVAFLIAPWIIAYLDVPNLFSVYLNAGVGAVGLVFLFGLCYGVGAVMFGQGIALLGISLGFAIGVGLITAIGSLVPMAMKPSIFLTPGGATVTVGIVVMVGGVIVSAIAGAKKEAQSLRARAADTPPNEKRPTGVFVKGLIICVMSGIFSPMLNFAFAFGDRIRAEAIASGAGIGASDAIWAVALLGAFLANAFACALYLSRNRTWSRFTEAGTGSYWPLAALMGLIWIVALAIYGRAAGMMGSLGGSAGWAIYMGCTILVSNVLGIVTGEWREGKGGPLRMMYVAITVILAAIGIIGYGNSLL
ncbi:MAG: L-rhamnose/proton symporter RhaT [Armatimonadota bacterium]